MTLTCQEGALSAMNWAWLELELKQWRKAGYAANLWWRDDDASEATSALDQLLDVQQARPMTLAVIPVGDLSPLAGRLRSARNLCIVQHGVDHQNRRAGPSAGEFPHEWRRIRIATQIRAGWKNLSRIEGAQAIYVPPWNDIHPELPYALSDCAYRGLSAWGGLSGKGAPIRVDAHLDLMRWKGGARFRGEGRFLRDFRKQLATRRKAGAWSAPIGLLTHHLAHDSEAWGFLGTFLDWTSGRTDLAWRALPDLLAESEMSMSPTLKD